MRKKCERFIMTLMCLGVMMVFSLRVEADEWIGTWATAPQLVETNNNPPSPYLANNSLRQIVQVSVGGKQLRLKLTNEYSNQSTEIKSVDIALAKTAGSKSDIIEETRQTLTFNGKQSLTMNAGGRATSDPIDFVFDDRANIAITIHFGQVSSTNVTGHPGSRTTSYIARGNTNNFSGAATTEHWYVIDALETVKRDEQAKAIAILGNSITDGRGSTTNEQNRWADVFSRRLLANDATKDMAVLNMGIGGNCVVSGGLGPAASKRYMRDLFGQEGVGYIILFEGVNDLGYSSNGVNTANAIINIYKQIISEAHRRGIFVYGGTIMPFKNGSYYSADHEKGRQTLNEWIRNSHDIDGVIDFDKVMQSVGDPEALNADYLFQNDWLHPNADGHRTMGESVDLTLFTRTDKPEYIDPMAGTERLYMEAENMIVDGYGTAFGVVDAESVSGGKYVRTVVNTPDLPTSKTRRLKFEFEVSKDTMYYVFARINCGSYDDDSYFIAIDEGDFHRANGLHTAGAWDWKNLGEFVDDGTKAEFFLTKGRHTLYIAGREDGACIDRVCVSSYSVAPTELGDENDVVDAIKAVEIDPQDAIHSLHVLSDGRVSIDYVAARENMPVRMSLYLLNGMEIASVSAVAGNAGHGSLIIPCSLPTGCYVCRLMIDNRSVTQKVIVH
jgi:lysophospholipase L1-like esterase